MVMFKSVTECLYEAILDDGTLPLPESDLLRWIRDTKLRLMIVKTILIDDIYIHKFIYKI